MRVASGVDDDSASGGHEGEDPDRLAALERQVAALTAEVALLRASSRQESSERASVPPPSPRMEPQIAAALHAPPSASPGTTQHGLIGRAGVTGTGGAMLDGDELESLVGRYGTLLLAALVILMGVGVLIQWSVAHGLLTPEVRVGLGALAAVGVGGAGLYFHRRGEVRYGNVLLALSLAIVDLVAWGAGPRLHLIPTGVALVIVDIVALALAALALHDESEFLFCIAVAGALSSPFVTSDGGGSAPVLLSYGACVIIGALRAVREPEWSRAFAVLAGGALVYALAAGAMPMAATWYAPFVVVLFGSVCALGALLLAQSELRSNLARAFLAVALVGVPIGWDRMVAGPWQVAVAVALAVAAVTYAALGAQPSPQQRLWAPSAILLPCVSLSIAWAVTRGNAAQSAVFGVWAMFAFAAWRFERRRGEPARGAVHLMVAGLLGIAAIGVLLWPYPLALVAGLAAWGVALSVVAREETSPLPLLAVAASLGGAAVSAFDQLASRPAYSYSPFLTRSSASAFCATLGLVLASRVLGDEEGKAKGWADRPVRLAIVIGFAILWGRMEFARAFSPDLSTFLLILYYASCGLVSIIVGRRLSLQRLRVAGLGLAIYAALKAVIQASEIGGIALRVGVYGLVGVFLLGAGYLYRVRRDEAAAAERAVMG